MQHPYFPAARAAHSLCGLSPAGHCLLLSLLLATAGPTRAQSVPIAGPAGSGLFGSSVTVLTNGNFVVADPGYDNGAILNVGAVYLYNGSTNALISTLTGSSANDYVGSYGVVALANGNYVVKSGSWNNGAAATAGAVTWGSGTAGVSGVVSAANSLVGTHANDYVGGNDVTVLANGNYAVRIPYWDNGANTDAGAVTWGSGTAGVSGAVSAANSLVGTSAKDNVGNGGVTALANGNYMVRSTGWKNGASAAVGALTLGDAQGGTTGSVTACNSIVGSVAGQGFSLVSVYSTAAATLLVGLQAENKVIVGVGAPVAPTGAASQSVSSTATVANLAATGTAVQWYATATGGTPLATSTPLAAGSTYYASQTIAGCESTARLAVVASLPLPVELMAFTVTADGPTAVRLAWATASEKNSQAFEVERSLDGRQFARIGTVAAAGSSSSARSYKLLDAQLPAGAALLYYRLRQVDADATFSYSPVRSVALKGLTGLALFPNPGTGRTTLTGAAPGALVTVYDGLGREVATAPANAAGTVVLALPAGLPAGVYVVRAGDKALRLIVE